MDYSSSSEEEQCLRISQKATNAALVRSTRATQRSAQLFHKDGVLSEDELERAIKEILRATSEPSSHSIIKEFTKLCLEEGDLDKNGSIDIDEWNKLYANILEHPKLPASLKPADSLIDNGDLIEISKKYMAALISVTRNAIFLADRHKFYTAAATRYLMWLNLRAKNPRKKLWIPRDSKLTFVIDINFMFICHLVHPVSYNNVTTKLFGRLKSKESLGDTRRYKNHTITMWKQEYNEHLLEMADNQYDYLKYVSTCSFEQELTVSLPDAGKSQLSFLANVTARIPLQVRCSNNFLIQAADNYAKFLKLKKVLKASGDNTTYLVPSLAIDMMWHSHMMYPREYRKDSKLYAGIVLDHNDTLDEKILATDWAATCSLWEE